MSVRLSIHNVNSYFLFDIRHSFGESNLVYQRKERQLNRIKNVTYPKAPQSCAEVIEAFKSQQIMNKYGFNLRGTEPLYAGGVSARTFAFCLFASAESISLVAAKIPPGKRNYLMDATFKIVPRGQFSQLLIIHIQWNGNVRNIILFFRIFIRSSND